MVRLEYVPAWYLISLKEFQFLNGTIGVTQKLITKNYKNIFQFLNGTIGVTRPPVPPTGTNLFQFLNGTIGVLRRAGKVPMIFDFNS